MICRVHQALVPPGLLVELLLNVVLHLVRYESACNFVGHLTDEGEVVGGKVLVPLLVGHFKDPNRMVAQLYGDQQHVSHHLVQLLIHSHVLTKLLFDFVIRRSLEVPCLACVEDLA